MREIKYRIWNEELEEMYTISKEKYLGSTGIVDPYVGHEKAVWLQFTGLTDKNGKEIYEGDILRLGSFIREDYKKRIGQVAFERGKYIFYENVIFKCDLDVMGATLEVIGNIYQNKELLKEKN